MNNCQQCLMPIQNWHMQMTSSELASVSSTSSGGCIDVVHMLVQGDSLDNPLLLTANPKLLAMSIGDNLVAMFHFTVGRPEPEVAAPMLAWARPAIIILVALVGVWHFRTPRWVPSCCILTNSCGPA